MTKYNKRVEQDMICYTRCDCGWVTTANSSKLLCKKIYLHKKKCDKPKSDDYTEYNTRINEPMNLPNTASI